MTLTATEGLLIAGNLRPSDWHERKRRLLENSDEKLWAQTFEEFFYQRLSLRYLKPIHTLQNEGTCLGEGFSIVTIQCALIEFLAATKEGKNYRFKNPGEHEYRESGKLFTKFLLTESPFNGWFVKLEQAEEFYANVRCALLHEARTKGGWRIWASGEIAVDPGNRLVRRDALQKGIDKYIEGYGRILSVDLGLQRAFIRKFDNLSIG